MSGLARWFLEPGALAWALALPVVLALWMLRLRREPLVVPSTLLWERLLADRQVNRPLERLRRSLLLVLQLLLVGLLAAAMMRPYTRGAAAIAERVVVVLDTTASMQATDVAPSRFAHARAEAARRVAALPAECEAMLVAAGPHPLVVAPFTRDRALLAARLEALAPADAGGNLADALALAAELANPRGAAPARIWVFSDGGAGVAHRTTAARALALDPAQVSFFRTGGPADNLAVLQVQARRVGARPADYEVFAQVASFARDPRTVAADLLRDGRLVDSRRVTLAPGERAALVFDGTHAGAARLTVALRSSDALALDDQAHAALPAAVTRRVTLTGDPEPWLERALALLPGVRVERAGAARSPARVSPGPAPSPARVSPGPAPSPARVSPGPAPLPARVSPVPAPAPDGPAPEPGGPAPAPAPGGGAAGQGAEGAGGAGLTIAVGAVPAVWPEGPVWLIAPTASSPAARFEGTLEAPAVLEADGQHPVLADVSLARARIDAGVRLVGAPGLAALVTGSAGDAEAPLLLAGELERPGARPARTVVMAFRPGASDLPLRPALPLLVANVVDWAFEPDERAVAIRAGTPLPVRFGEELTVRDPAGAEEILEAGGRGLNAERVGFWTLTPARGAARTVAVNLADAGESDLTPGPGPTLGTRTLADTGEPPESDRELSRTCLTLVFILLVFEWLVHHRRWAA